MLADQAAHGAGCAAELDKDAVRLRQERHTAAGVIVTVEPIDEMQWFMDQLPRLRLHRKRLLGGARRFSGK
jgi:hypothetical protein